MTSATNGAVWRAALMAGLAAGALDITAAILLNLRYGPAVVLQSVASGWMGRAAYQGGWTTAGLGLAAHFAIMLAIAALYMHAAARLPTARTRWITAGIVWGVLVWVGMTLVVVPLSASPLPIPDALHIAQGIVVHVLMVGLPMAWIASRLLGPRERASA